METQKQTTGIDETPVSLLKRLAGGELRGYGDFYELHNETPFAIEVGGILVGFRGSDVRIHLASCGTAQLRIPEETVALSGLAVHGPLTLSPELIREAVIAASEPEQL